MQLWVIFGKPKSGDLQTLWEGKDILLLGERDLVFWVVLTKV